MKYLITVLLLFVAVMFLSADLGPPGQVVQDVPYIISDTAPALISDNIYLYRYTMADIGWDDCMACMRTPVSSGIIWDGRANVELIIYNKDPGMLPDQIINGQKVRTLVNRMKDAGFTKIMKYTDNLRVSNDRTVITAQCKLKIKHDNIVSGLGSGITRVHSTSFYIRC